jgi:hypothetical protein
MGLIEVEGPQQRRRRHAAAAALAGAVDPLKIYMAGKIGGNDWRHTIVPHLRDDDRAWCKKDTLPTSDGNAYVGPFFISCDHRCYHGANCHGARNGWDCLGVPSPTEQDVFNKAVEGIQACDLFFAWAGPDFSTAYGTHVELGMACALGKKIIIGQHPSLEAVDQWFAFQCCTEKVYADDPIEAYRLAMTLCKSSRKLFKAA